MVAVGRAGGYGGVVGRAEQVGEVVAFVIGELDGLPAIDSSKVAGQGAGVIDPQVGFRGIEGDEKVVAVSQGWKLTGTIKTAEVRLSDGKLIHAAQRLMDWCVGNAATEPRGNAMLVTKAASGTAKIDPLMALLNAIALMGRNPEARSGTAYADGRDLLVI